jgi:hypothetical protein
LRTIRIRELVGHPDEVLFFSDQVISHATVALPAVGSAISLAGAGDHVSAAAIVADSTAGDVIDDDAVAFPRAPAAWPDFDYLTSGLMSGNHVLVAFGAFAKVLMVNASDIGAAYRGSLHTQQHFTVARHWIRHIAKDRRTVARQVCPFHFVRPFVSRE